MIQQLLSLLMLLIAPMVISLGVAVHAWRQRPGRSANALFVFQAVTTVFLGLYWLQLVSVSSGWARFWLFAALPWRILLAAGWLVLALHVAGFERRMRTIHYGLLSIIPLVLTVLAWSNPLHGLFARDFEMIAVGPFQLLNYQSGPLDTLFLVSNVLLIITGTAILLLTVIGSTHKNPWQALWISLAALAPVITHILFELGYSPIEGVNMAPFSFSVAGLALAVSLFHYNFLELAPVARAAIFTNIQVGVLVLDLNDMIADANPAALRMLAPLSAAVIGESVRDLFPDCKEKLNESPELEFCQDINVDALEKTAVYEASVSSIIDSTGRARGHLITLQDVTVRRQIEHAERHHRRLAETLREVGLALSTLLDPDALLDVLLEQINRVVPYDSINIMLLEGDHLTIVRQRGYEDFGVEEGVNTVQTHIDDLAYFTIMRTTHKPALVSDTTKDPDWVVLEASRHVKSWLGAPIVVHEQLVGFLSIDKAQPGFYTDEHVEAITPLAAHAGLALENARLHAEQQYQASHDSLTDLPNRTLFFDRLHHAIELARRKGNRTAIFFLDLDGFKTVNDQYGHDVGDWLLREVARRLSAVIRQSDTVARMGGDEFTIILESLSMTDDPRIVAQKVCGSVEKPYRREGIEIIISASIGIACYPDHGLDADQLVKKADQAMYRAKQLGKNRIVVSE